MSGFDLKQHCCMQLHMRFRPKAFGPAFYRKHSPLRLPAYNVLMCLKG
uniref:Uncharacterized protein n=1 Tax=Arundo donax TaxID=35708 RepID=A0A0A9BCI0_ARUDO